MPKIFTVKLPPKSGSPPAASRGEYVVVACPKCGKRTYGMVGQKGKKCPVCRRQFPMPASDTSPRFTTPEEACRYIQAEEAKRAGRLDFAPAAGGFRPVTSAPILARTTKVIADPKTLDTQFLTWVKHYFSAVVGNGNAGIPKTVVIAAAAKAGFAGADKLIEKAVAAGILYLPKPYLVGLR